MQKTTEPAATHWEVDRQAKYASMKAYCLVILRSKNAKRSVVKASSTDFESMKDYADNLQKDLQELTNQEFINKYDLSSLA